MQPAWLGDADHYMGTVESFIPGQNERPAAIVGLDRPMTVDGVSGEVVVLELRYVGSEWSEGGTVHVELCDFVPEPKSWSQRRQGKWVESNASYEKAYLSLNPDASRAALRAVRSAPVSFVR